MAGTVRVRISWTSGSVEGELVDSPTSRALVEALPITARANTWGDEVYFDVPVQSTLDANPKQVVDPGTIGFWVQGSAVAIPFGPTPISEGSECRLVTAVNVLGKIDGDPTVLRSVNPGDAVTVELVEP